MRAKTVIHVEYEILKAILQSKEIGMVIERVKADMVPLNDTAAEKRFTKGVNQSAQFIRGMIDRRTHRLPLIHPDYAKKVKKPTEEE